jgi:hypothetical protein
MVAEPGDWLDAEQGVRADASRNNMHQPKSESSADKDNGSDDCIDRQTARHRTIKPLASRTFAPR